MKKVQKSRIVETKPLKISLARKFVFEFESIEGAGQSALIKSLSDKLNEKYDNVKIYSEPYNKDIINIKENNSLAIALYIADRYYHIQKILKSPPGIYLLDRYIFSTFVFQGIKANESEDLFMRKAQREFERPDLIFFIDRPTNQCLKKEQILSVLTKERELYLKYLIGNSITKIINGELPDEVIINQIYNYIDSLVSAV